MKKMKTPVLIALKVLACVFCVGLTLMGLRMILTMNNPDKNANAVVTSNYVVMDRYEKYITNSFSDTLEGILSIKKVYWLSDSDIVAPQPNPAGFGETSDPKTMQPVLDQAKELLEGQELVFSTDVELCPGSVIRYYYDPTILVITWQIVRDDCVYTISEVKVADDSQFRRFLADGEYGSGSKSLTTEMADTVNAVVASNGDYYNIRHIGTIVYNSQLMRMEGHRMDTCFVDGNGDLNFVQAGEITSKAEMEKYLEEKQVRFSLAFGPILVNDGQAVKFKSPYCVGEVDIPNARAALCQKGSLHYLLVLANGPAPYENVPVLTKFAQRLEELGVDKAYNLDGGRSAIMVMNNEQVNYVYERKVSDIIYFATAYSNGE